MSVLIWVILVLHVQGVIGWEMHMLIEHGSVSVYTTTQCFFINLLKSLTLSQILVSSATKWG